MHPENAAPLGLALLGLLLGMRHATDPDHVIAVTTILSRERRLSTATRVGIIWGLGHTITVLAVGAAIILFKIAIPARLGLAMEFAVAIVLILLGFRAAADFVGGIGSRVFSATRADQPMLVHSHPHRHGGSSHSHSHAHSMNHDHEDAAADSDEVHRDHLLPEGTTLSFAARQPLLRSFAVGLVHGLAGSAAIALLVLSAIPEPLWASLYLVIFCVGTIIGMALITTAIAAPFLLAANRMFSLHRGLVTGSGLLSFGFGLILAYQLGVVDHLFSGPPLWTPH